VFFANPLPSGDPHRARRVFLYAEQKFNALMFNILGQTEFSNTIISYIDSVFAPLTEAMKAGADTFNKSTGAMIDGFDRRQVSIGNIASRFSDIDKGFSVVTSEIRKHAARTKEAVDEIADSIKTS
jgi:hypothetical protein